MTKERDLTSVIAMLDLNEEEFARMLPDLEAFYAFGRKARAMGAEVSAFYWVDDGLSGEVSKVYVEVDQ